jgi:ATP-binding cassette subfamily F protein 3
MVRVTSLHHAFGAQVLFEDVNFTIGRGERVGLVGRNGSGKTTLLNFLAGLAQPEGGTIVYPREYSTGYMKQQNVFASGTVRSEAYGSLPTDERDDTWRAEKVLSGLGFTEKQLDQEPSSLSDGFQVRLNLGKVLITGGDLLLLDEPTNYLDILSIRWLERFLGAWPGELMVITHDRSFMDSVTTHVMMIHRRRVRKVRGSTAKLYEQVAREEEIHEKTRINDQRRREEIEEFINRFRAKARLAGLVQSRIKSLQKRVQLDRLERIENLDFSFNCVPLGAKYVMEIKGVSFSYGEIERPLIEDLSLVITRTDRIGIVGKNGKGKSTLLKLLSGALQPQGGVIKTHPKASIGSFGQMVADLLHDEYTIEEELGSVRSGLPRREIMNLCGTMMFGGDLSRKRIAVLSGGERSRVLLAKLLLTPVNLLLLDEPTNHLDMESCDSLVSAIDRFDGATLIATHNEMFLHTLATRLIVFEGDRPFLFEGSYQDFLEQRGWEDEREPGESPSRTGGRRELRVLRAEIIGERSRELGPIERRITEQEREIENLERVLEESNQAIIEASAEGKGDTIQDLSKKLHQLRSHIGELYAELEGLLDEHEHRSRRFERMLYNLEG